MSGATHITFFGYFLGFFKGIWGNTSEYYPGTPVIEILGGPIIFQTIEFLWVPILLGIIGGITLGRISFKIKGKWSKKVSQLSIAIGMAFPIFFLGLLLQYNSIIGGETHSSLMLFFSRLPYRGFKSGIYADPIFLTGFPILDARFSGDVYLAIDRIEHLILPIFTLTPVIIAFVAWQTRSTLERKQSEKSIVSLTMKTLMIFGFVFSFYILTEELFNLRGIADIIRRAILLEDVYLIMGTIFVILIILVVITFISGIIYSFTQFLKTDRKEFIESNSPQLQSDEKKNLDETEPGVIVKRGFKKYFKNLFKYPLFLLGLIIIIGIIFCAIFAELLSGYTLAEARSFSAGSWEPPSPDHILGQSQYGFDVFARILFGLHDVLLYGVQAVFFALAGGLLFGLISSIHRYFNRALGLMLLTVTIIPILFLIFLANNVIGSRILLIPSLQRIPFESVTLISGFFLIPIFTRAITKVPLRKKNIILSIKNIFIYLPLAFGIFILIYESLAYLGISNIGYPTLANIALGTEIRSASIFYFFIDAPWTVIWPGLFIFFMVFGFFILHFGLKNAFLEKSNSSSIDENLVKEKE
ncbi:MAG: hypothetical protein ACFFE4_04125 [Candidatus Thorarchaeota archaeon]